MLLLICVIMIPAVTAGQLLEMEFEFIDNHNYKVARDDNIALLYVESPIEGLLFDTTNRILDTDYPESGIYELRLAPGRHLLTIRAEGYVTLQGISLTLRPKQVSAIRVAAKAPPAPRFDPAGRRIGGEAPVWDSGVVQQHVVRFESDPSGAEVRIDGEYLCQTPCSRALSEGEHHIEMRLARHADHRATITITEPMSVRSALTPLFGWVSVRTEPPGLAIELNGKPIGNSPIVRQEVDPGLHTVKVVDPIYRVDGVEDFQVTGNQHRELPVLRPVAREGLIRVQAVTAGIKQNALSRRVKIDNQEVGSTPWSGRLLIGLHQVTVGKESRTVTITESGTTDVVFELLENELQATTVLSDSSLVFWSAAVAGDGTIDVGSGHQGRVWRVDRRGQASLLVELQAEGVFSLLRDGDQLLAGCGPGGQVFAIDRRGEAALRGTVPGGYVWDLERAADGVVYLAVGSPAAVYRLAGTGEPELVVELPASNALDLAIKDDGTLLVATHGPGRVFAIQPRQSTWELVLAMDQDEGRQVLRGPDGWYALGFQAEPEQDSSGNQSCVTLYWLDGLVPHRVWSSERGLTSVVWSDDHGWVGAGSREQNGPTRLFNLTMPNGSQPIATWDGGDVLELLVVGQDSGPDAVLAVQAHPSRVTWLDVAE